MNNKQLCYPDLTLARLQDLQRTFTVLGAYGEIDLEQFRAAYLWWKDKMFDNYWGGNFEWYSPYQLKHIAQNELGVYIGVGAMMAALCEYGVAIKHRKMFVVCKISADILLGDTTQHGLLYA